MIPLADDALRPVGGEGVVGIDELAAAVPAGQLIEVLSGDRSRPITDLTHDSRAVAPGSAFACVVGERFDGHQFVANAVEAGAVVVVVQHPVATDVPQLVVRDVRAVMGGLAAVVHGRPAERLRTIGVTGTNGKTTTTQLLAAVLRAAGLETRVQGTLSGARTTPEGPDLQRQLAGYVDDGVDAVAMEVSSHALALHRVNGMHFDVAVFTNLGRDHLDLHESMEAYFRAKASLFTPQLSAVGVTNVDDTYGRLLLDAAEIDMVAYGLDDAGDIAVGAADIAFTWRGRHVRLPIGGHFNVPNALAALTAASVLGIDLDVAVAGIGALPPVPGRFEVVSAPDARFAVVVDYAHTPDGIVEVLRSARAVAAGGRVIVVFGCGGDRDTDKRPLMGAAAAAHADVAVLTSDNPRHEDPMAIIDAALAGVEPGRRDVVHVEVDRRAAIRHAVGLARTGDIIVIAGKGHETTQTIGDAAVPFDDRVVAREVLADADALDRREEPT